MKNEIQTEGTHVVIPWFEWPIIFDIRTRPRAIKSQSGTRDLQMVDIGLRVLTRPDPSRLPEIYRRIGPDYDDKILPSIVNEVLKQVIAQFNATALLTQREQVSSDSDNLHAPMRSEAVAALQSHLDQLQPVPVLTSVAVCFLLCCCVCCAGVSQDQDQPGGARQGVCAGAGRRVHHGPEVWS